MNSGLFLRGRRTSLPLPQIIFACRCTRIIALINQLLTSKALGAGNPEVRFASAREPCLNSVRLGKGPRPWPAIHPRDRTSFSFAPPPTDGSRPRALALSWTSSGFARWRRSMSLMEHFFRQPRSMALCWLSSSKPTLTHHSPTMGVKRSALDPLSQSEGFVSFVPGWSTGPTNAQICASDLNSRRIDGEAAIAEALSSGLAPLASPKRPLTPQADVADPAGR